MALLWMDGFDHYGSTIAPMTDGAWAEVGAGYSLSSSNPRTGAYGVQRDGTSGGEARRILGGAKTTVGLGAAMHISALPSSNDRYVIFSFRDTNNDPQVQIVLESTGKVAAYRGPAVGAVLLGVSASPVVVAAAYQHVEAKVAFSNSAGAVEVRVNGVTVLNLSSVDTVATANVECSQVGMFHNFNSNMSCTTSFDDVFAWDTSGAQNTDFLGDRRVRTFYPDGDTATAGWSPVGAATGYDCINDTSPDDDTTYISAAPLVGSPPTELVSEFTLQDAPAGIGAIAAVQTYVRARKTQAGDANIEVGMVSGSSVSAGAGRAITEQYTYWMDVHELNPDTGTPWNEATLTASKVRITRTL